MSELSFEVYNEHAIAQDSLFYFDELPQTLEATTRVVENSVFADVEINGKLVPWLTCNYDQDGNLTGQTFVDLATGKTEYFIRYEYDSEGRMQHATRYDCS